MFLAVTIAPVTRAMLYKIEHIALILMNVLRVLMDATSMQHVQTILVHTHVNVLTGLLVMDTTAQVNQSFSNN